MKKKYLIIVLFSVMAIITSCTGKKSYPESMDGDTIALKYSKLLHFTKYHDYILVKISNPWKKGQILHTYILVSKDKSLPANIPEGTVLRTPLSRVVVFPTAHCYLMGVLGAGHDIKGVCDLKYILLPWIQHQCKVGKITDCGDGMSPVTEKIIDAKPDAMLVSPFENSSGYGKIEELGIPLIECADYMETSALGRAEWMKFYGMLFDVEQRADSLFNVVDSNYTSLMKTARRSHIVRSMITERKTGPVWYVAGGQSSIGRMITDANGRYAFSDDTHSGSLPLPFETVLDKAGNSDLWLFKYNGTKPFTYNDLMAECSGYSELKSVKDRQVYGCNASAIPFFEETPFRPDWLLRDFIILLHPDIMTLLGTPKYYTKL